MQDIDLEYYMFDWDDNIMFMPTLIYLQRNGEPVNVTTERFAEVRKDESYGPIDGDWDKAFTLFRDPPQGSGDFVGDTNTAISNHKFAPSYPAFKKALHDAAQGHYKQQIGMVVEALVVASTSQEDVNLVTRYFQSR